MKLKQVSIAGLVAILLAGCGEVTQIEKPIIQKNVKQFHLKINTIPKDATIKVDSNNYVENMKLREGNHSIEITKKYYYPIKDEISLNKNETLNYKLKFVYADKIESLFNKKIDAYVYQKTDDCLIFSSYDNLITYIIAKIADGKDLSKMKFKITNGIFGGRIKVFNQPLNQELTLDRLTHSNYPFIKIIMITNRIVDLYLNSIEPLPKPIVEKGLPEFVKSQFETQKMFQERLNKAIALREQKMRELENNYNKKIDIRNAELSYLHNIIPEKRKQFQRTALKLFMGNFYLKNPKYDAETQTMYVTLKLSRSIYEKRIALVVPLNIAKDFYYHLGNAKIDANFDFTQYNITLDSLKVYYKGYIFLSKEIK